MTFYDLKGNQIENGAIIEVCYTQNENSITCAFTKRDGIEEDCLTLMHRGNLAIYSILYGSAELRDAAFERLKKQVLHIKEIDTCSADRGTTYKL